jgi:ELWxxDGT repeat protein
MVANLDPEHPGSSDLSDLVNVNGELFFAGYDVLHGYQLWKSDGTAGGTVRVTDVNAPAGGFSNLQDLTSFNGELYFFANDRFDFFSCGSPTARQPEQFW